MSFWKAAATAVVALVPQLAVAAGNNGTPIEMTLEQLKDKCRQLQHEVEHGQMQPFTINLECARDRTFWAPEESQRPLPEVTFHTGSADVKGRFVVAPSRQKTGEQAAPYACTILYEWKVQSFRIPVTLQTCSELEQVQSLAFFCGTKVPQDVDEAEPVKTGRFVDMCSTPITDPCPDDGEQQQQQCGKPPRP